MTGVTLTTKMALKDSIGALSSSLTVKNTRESGFKTRARTLETVVVSAFGPMAHATMDTGRTMKGTVEEG